MPSALHRRYEVHYRAGVAAVDVGLIDSDAPARAGYLGQWLGRFRRVIGDCRLARFVKAPLGLPILRRHQP